MLFTEIAEEGDFHLFEVGEGGNGAQIIVSITQFYQRLVKASAQFTIFAFRVEDRAVLDEWTTRFESFGFHTSGYVNRHFFESLYTRVAPQILFELATDSTWIYGDEPYETLGEKLSLPPFLEPKREQIEKLVRPIDTVRSSETFEKEYE